MSGYNSAKEENDMRVSAWLFVLLLIGVLLARPRPLYACPS
jgi:hypothetical protein